MCFGPRASSFVGTGGRRPSRRAVLGGAAAAGLIGLVGCGRTGEPAPAENAAVTPRPPGPARAFAVRDVAVFDGERSLAPSTVLVDDGRVRAVGPDVRVPDGVEVVDGSGRTLLPGLIDSHVHALSASSDGPRFGVTTELDMFTFTEVLGPYREQRASIEPTALSDVWSAGILATVPGGHGTQFGPVPTVPVASGEREADAFVAERLAEGSDYLKIIIEGGGLFSNTVPTLRGEQVAALAAAARRRRVMSVAHVGQGRDGRAALDAGVDGWAHSPGDVMPEDLVGRTAAQDVFVVATLSVYDTIGCGDGARSLADDPRVGPLLTNEQRAALAGSWGRCQSAIPSAAAANVGALHAAGATVLAGTDVGNPGVARGASLHQELELLTRAGLTPSDALRAATAEPARRFALDRRGRIAPDHRADLVLVRGDPTRDITATRNIEAVWRNGGLVDRRA